MNLAELIKRPPDADTLSLWLQKVPYAVHLGIRAEVHDGDILFILPADRKLVVIPPCQPSTAVWWGLSWNRRGLST